MPIFEHRCTVCQRVTEDLYRGSCPETITCKCGGLAKKKLSLSAKTPGRWGDAGLGGSSVTGVYDRGLGATYHNSMERDRLIEQRGVVPLSDVGGDYAMEDWIEKRKTQDKATDAYNSTFDKTLAETKDIYTAHDKALESKNNV